MASAEAEKTIDAAIIAANTKTKAMRLMLNTTFFLLKPCWPTSPLAARSRFSSSCAATSRSNSSLRCRTSDLSKSIGLRLPLLSCLPCLSFKGTL